MGERKDRKLVNKESEIKIKKVNESSSIVFKGDEEILILLKSKRPSSKKN